MRDFVKPKISRKRQDEDSHLACEDPMDKPPVVQIQDVANCLASRVELLETRLKDLVYRIQPVLRPAEPSPAIDNCGPENDELCPLAICLFGFSVKLDGVNEVLADVLARLEV